MTACGAHFAVCGFIACPCWPDPHDSSEVPLVLGRQLETTETSLSASRF
ncbi:hypothetical protein E2C01_069986 [Portunus trituberculatus]|uniref:Uncharacterized protein n=1 Tax=Portunus trituberculatus TaxID=210409 RepID=A0A5B7I0X2_PORTR|nr:hypothetical protein [Portunus trituberculatus]